MDILTKLITVVGSIFVVVGLFNVLMGSYNLWTGYKNDDANKTDQGIKSMVIGGAMAAISGGVTAAIVSAIGQIQF